MSDSSRLMQSIGSFLPRRKSRATTTTDDKSRSHSLDNTTANDAVEVKPKDKNGVNDEVESWKDLSLIKSMSPVVMCVLPSTAKEFVAAALLAIGAYPLIPEEAEDVGCQLGTAQVVLIDTSAQRNIVEAVMEHYIVATVPLVLVCWESGTNDARKNLTRKVAEVCSPTVITGRLGDIHALSLDIMNRADGIIDAHDDEKESERKYLTADKDSKLPFSTASLDRSPSPRFARKREGKPYKRQNTIIPQMALKGQFRHQSIKDISIPLALESARKLAAQLACYVHLYETNVATCGEFFYEINNTQFGMERLHHTVQCAAGVMAAVIACVDQQGKDVNLVTCGHALSLYHVAAEEAATVVSSNKELVSPGSLKVEFIDMLHKLDEQTVRSKAQIVFHNAPPTR